MMILKFTANDFYVEVDVADTTTFATIKEELESCSKIKIKQILYMGILVNRNSTPAHWELQEGSALTIVPYLDPSNSSHATQREQHRRPAKSKYVDIGSRVSYQHIDGSWSEAVIHGIYFRHSRVKPPLAIQTKHKLPRDEGLVYDIVVKRFRYDGPFSVFLSQLRPLASVPMNVSKMKKGDFVLTKINTESQKPPQWFYVKITSAGRNMKCDILLPGRKVENMRLDTSRVHFKIPWFQVSKRKNLPKQPTLCSRMHPSDLRAYEAYTCKVCVRQYNKVNFIMCQRCEEFYHMRCLGMQTKVEPWHCSECKERGVPRTNQMRSVDFKANTFLFGCFPGIIVGRHWSNQSEVFASGIHKEMESEVYGSETVGVASMILSGKEIDHGDSFVLHGWNKALLKNTGAAELMNENNRWYTNPRHGKPIRVLRSSQNKQHSKYYPISGIRYDGLYKVRMCWLDEHSDAWNFELYRHDSSPVPWDTKGRKRSIEVLDGEECDDAKEVSGKRQRVEPYNLPSGVAALIQRDQLNRRRWDDCEAEMERGAERFLEKLWCMFECAVCLELLTNPVTTPCAHNFCLKCLEGVLAHGKTCPECRHELSERDLKENDTLQSILSRILEVIK